MGVLLSKPNTEKDFDEGGNAKLQYAACSMQVQGTLIRFELLNGILKEIIWMSGMANYYGGRPHS